MASLSSAPLRRPARLPSSVAACALMAFLGFVMSLQVAVAMPPLMQADERAHAAYAIDVAHGTLPTIDSPIPDDPGAYPALAHSLIGQDRAHRDVWTANHPPLYYLLSVPLVKFGDAIGHPGLTLLGMRLLNGIGFAITVLLVGLIARELVPRRPAVPVIATAFTLSAGSMTYLGGAIYNDGLGSATAFALLLLGVRMLRSGVTRTRLAWAAVLAVAAASARSSGLAAVAVVCLAIVVAAVLADRSRQGLTRGLGTGFLVGLAPVLAIGWFYVRNMHLYGGATAQKALFNKFWRHPNGSVLHQLTSGSFYQHLLGSLWSDGDIPKYWGVVAVLLGALVVSGAVIGARRRWLAGQRPVLSIAGLTSLDPSAQRRLAAWSLVVLYALFNVVSVAGFVAGGGWMHSRYAVPLLPWLAPFAALALLRLGAVARPWAARLTRAHLAEVSSPRALDAQLAFPISVGLLVVGIACHIDTERFIDGPLVSVLHGGVVVGADLLLLATAVSVIDSLRRRLQAMGGGAPVVREPVLADDRLAATHS